MQNKILTQSLSAFRIVLISSLTIFTLYTVQAWISPTVSAPNGNVGGTLTTATTTQVKTGSLGLLDNLSIGKDLIVNGTTTTLGNILVNGGIIATGTITATGKIIANGGFQLITGATLGKVLMSDASGNASWITPTGVGTGMSGILSPLKGMTISCSPSATPAWAVQTFYAKVDASGLPFSRIVSSYPAGGAGPYTYDTGWVSGFSAVHAWDKASMTWTLTYPSLTATGSSALSSIGPCTANWPAI